MSGFPIPAAMASVICRVVPAALKKMAWVRRMSIVLSFEVSAKIRNRLYKWPLLLPKKGLPEILFVRRLIFPVKPLAPLMAIFMGRRFGMTNMKVAQQESRMMLASAVEMCAVRL